jgi:uncharacterized protein YndB with AHSA1/START domain
MTVTPFCHGTFTLRRTWATSPAHVFRAWSDPELKAQWFTGPKDRWTMTRRSIDFREGGTEILEGRFNESGSTGLYEARFHLIEPDQRIIYTYDLHHTGRFHSVTLSSLVLQPEAGRTHVSYTEQIVFIDGRDGTADRQHGTELQFSAIASVLGMKEDKP